MTVSFDQVRRQSFRALDAAGAAAGIDEDSALAVAWLEAAGFAGLRMLADALDATARDERAAPLAQAGARADAFDGEGRSAVFYAPTLCDHVNACASAGTVTQVIAHNMRDPLFVFAAAARFAEAPHEVALIWAGDDGRKVRASVSAKRASIAGEDDADMTTCTPSSAVDLTIAVRGDDGGGNTFPLEIVSADTLRDAVRCALERGLDVDQAAYDRVSVYASGILVPETEDSRLSGAGAGLTDND